MCILRTVFELSVWIGHTDDLGNIWNTLMYCLLYTALYTAYYFVQKVCEPVQYGYVQNGMLVDYCSVSVYYVLHSIS